MSSPTKVEKKIPKKKSAVSALRELGKQKHIKGTEILKRYREQLKNKAQKKKLTEKTSNISYLKVKAKIPISINQDAKRHLKDLKETKKVKKIQLKEGLKHGGNLVYKSEEGKESSLGKTYVSTDRKKIAEKEDNFGLDIDIKGKKIKLSLHHPSTPTSLRVSSHKYQGDLSYRMKKAIEKKKEGVKK